MSHSSFDLIVSDIHHRISGVSATVRAIIPKLVKKQTLALVTTQPFDTCNTWSLFALFKQTKYSPNTQSFYIWHVRRNNEMTWALIFKYVFRRNLHIVFTSAAIRKHSWWPRQLIDRMDTIIATSEKAAKFMPKVVEVIPHGVDLSIFSAGQVTQPIDEHYQQGTCYVGIIGRVRPEKGTHLLVKSCLSLMAEHTKVKAVIVGKTTAKYQRYKKSLMNEIAQAGLSDQFIWLDEVTWESMPDIYRGLDIVVCPAAYEGFGLVPLEAGACGCAVIATKTGAYEEIIEEGETGHLIDIGDQQALDQQLEHLITHNTVLERMKSQAVTRIQTKFSLDNEVNAINAVYQKIWKEQ